MDKIVDKIAALGVPGLVLLIAIAVAGPTGGAAIVVALAFLGGPLGMIGGIGLLVLIALISRAIAAYGAEALARRVVERLRDDGHTHEEIRRRIAGYPISRGLRRDLLAFLDGLQPHGAEPAR